MAVFPGSAHPKVVTGDKALTLMLQVSPGREKELTLLGEKAGPPRWPPVFPSCISETLNWDLRGLLLKFVYLRMIWK